VQAVTPAATNLLSQATGVTPAQVQSEAGDVARDPNFQAFVAGVIKNGEVTPQDHQALANLLVSRRGMSPQDANATIDRWQAQIEQTVQQTKQTATEAATGAASGASKGAFGSFVALLLGLAAAVWGSWTGTQEAVRPRPIVPRIAA
jgi:sirohydrochlorin ferrochelatase